MINVEFYKIVFEKSHFDKLTYKNVNESKSTFKPVNSNIEVVSEENILSIDAYVYDEKNVESLTKYGYIEIKGHEKGFFDTGDLNAFMKWFIEKDNPYPRHFDEKNQVYHVITHSNVMRTYFAYINSKKIHEQVLIIHNSNLNSFRTQYNIEERLNSYFGITRGVPRNDKLEGIYEDKNLYSLCNEAYKTKGGKSKNRKTKKNHK